jgi:hypothetical protein
MAPEDTIRRFCDAITAHDGDAAAVLAVEGGDGRYDVTARRVQHWSETGELAVDQELSILVELNDEGLVSRAEMRPKTD